MSLQVKTHKKPSTRLLDDPRSSATPIKEARIRAALTARGFSSADNATALANEVVARLSGAFFPDAEAYKLVVELVGLMGSTQEFNAALETSLRFRGRRVLDDHFDGDYIRWLGRKHLHVTDRREVDGILSMTPPPILTPQANDAHRHEVSQRIKLTAHDLEGVENALELSQQLVDRVSNGTLTASALKDSLNLAHSQGWMMDLSTSIEKALTARRLEDAKQFAWVPENPFSGVSLLVAKAIVDDTLRSKNPDTMLLVEALRKPSRIVDESAIAIQNAVSNRVEFNSLLGHVFQALDSSVIWIARSYLDARDSEAFLKLAATLATLKTGKVSRDGHLERGVRDVSFLHSVLQMVNENGWAQDVDGVAGAILEQGGRGLNGLRIGVPGNRLATFFEQVLTGEERADAIDFLERGIPSRMSSDPTDKARELVRKTLDDIWGTDEKRVFKTFLDGNERKNLPQLNEEVGRLINSHAFLVRHPFMAKRIQLLNDNGTDTYLRFMMEEELTEVQSQYERAEDALQVGKDSGRTKLNDLLFEGLVDSAETWVDSAREYPVLSAVMLLAPALLPSSWFVPLSRVVFGVKTGLTATSSIDFMAAKSPEERTEAGIRMGLHGSGALLFIPGFEAAPPQFGSALAPRLKADPWFMPRVVEPALISK